MAYPYRDRHRPGRMTEDGNTPARERTSAPVHSDKLSDIHGRQREKQECGASCRLRFPDAPFCGRPIGKPDEAGNVCIRPVEKRAQSETGIHRRAETKIMEEKRRPNERKPYGNAMREKMSEQKLMCGRAAAYADAFGFNRLTEFVHPSVDNPVDNLS